MFFKLQKILNNTDIFVKNFNDIDKKLDEILQLEKHLPFNEKLKFIAKWDFFLSNYINRHYSILKQLWEIRNELVHWQKIYGNSLIQPTKQAIKEIKKHKKNICNPITVWEIFYDKTILWYVLNNFLLQTWLDKELEIKYIKPEFLLLNVQNFFQKCEKNKKFWLLIITNNWKKNWDIKWIISPFNYAKIFKYL